MTMRLDQIRQFRTHYDNLQVSRKASPEVIRAAYKSLCRKYHPDTNPSNPEAVRIMRIINEAYETLSDPEKRKHHDEWIDEMLSNQGEDKTFDDVDENNIKKEYSANHFEDESTNKPKDTSYKSSPFEFPLIGFFRELWSLNSDHFKKWGFIYLIIFFIVVVGIINDNTSNTSSTSTLPTYSPPVVSEPPEQTSNYIRPATAPNGLPWPELSGYIEGYKKRFRGGLSTLTIDNTGTNTDVFLKLFTLDVQKPFAVRHIFIKAGDKFTMRSIKQGNYDVRYCILDSGTKLKSESFNLQEINEGDGTRYSNVTMTLYKVVNGNMQTTSIDTDDFEDGLPAQTPTE